MKDTSMLRIDPELKKALKVEATKQGRTLEWVANEAIVKYLKTPNTPLKVIEPSVVYDISEIPELPHD